MSPDTYRHILRFPAILLLFPLTMSTFLGSSSHPSSLYRKSRITEEIKKALLTEKLKLLLLGRMAMSDLNHVLKSRDLTVPTKVHIVKAMVFPAVKYGCDSWTIKKAECQRTDAFLLWN